MDELLAPFLPDMPPVCALPFPAFEPLMLPILPILPALPLLRLRGGGGGADSFVPVFPPALLPGLVVSGPGPVMLPEVLWRFGVPLLGVPVVSFGPAAAPVG